MLPYVAAAVGIYAVKKAYDVYEDWSADKDTEHAREMAAAKDKSDAEKAEMRRRHEEELAKAKEAHEKEVAALVMQLRTMESTIAVLQDGLATAKAELKMAVRDLEASKNKPNELHTDVKRKAKHVGKGEEELDKFLQAWGSAKDLLHAFVTLDTCALHAIFKKDKVGNSQEDKFLAAVENKKLTVFICDAVINELEYHATGKRGTDLVETAKDALTFIRKNQFRIETADFAQKATQSLKWYRENISRGKEVTADYALAALTNKIKGDKENRYNDFCVNTLAFNLSTNNLTLVVSEDQQMDGFLDKNIHGLPNGRYVSVRGFLAVAA